MTGVGLPNEEAIWDGPNEIRDKWAQVKDICPWFYKMRDMIEDRFDDIGAAITNSRRDIALDAIQDGDRRRKEKESELEEVLGKGDDDEMDNDVDEEKSTSSSPGTARRPSPHLNVERLTSTYRLGTYTVPLRPATLTFGVLGPSLLQIRCHVRLDRRIRKG